MKGTPIFPPKALTYLGVWLDTKLTFREHVNRTVAKIEKTVTALSSLMPNIGGARSSKRKVLSSVAHSQILYADAVRRPLCENKKLLSKVARIQRQMCIRVCCAYRTISYDAIGVFVGIPPIELLIKEREEIYYGDCTKTC